jgi:hypothetical protein
MTVRCISCKKFMLKARDANGSNQALREIDSGMVAIGLGRCSIDPAPNTWYSQEYERSCEKHDPLTIEQTEQRRVVVVQRRTNMLEWSQ